MVLAPQRDRPALVPRRFNAAQKSFSYTSLSGYMIRLLITRRTPLPLLDTLLGPITSIIDKIIPDKDARDKAKLELIRLQGSQDLAEIQAQLSAIVAEASSHDPWTSRARPSFLYVIYALILWALPMGVLAAFNPAMAAAIGKGMNAYLGGLPEPLYMLFGTGYLGYTAARQWGKIAGADK
jgi:hypothetical protein